MLAYLGWGNSTQKANRLYSKHLSEEIKSQLISMSDDYKKMKNWLIENYGSPSCIVPWSTHKVQIEKQDSSDSESESSVYIIYKSSSKQWRPSSSMKFPCPINGHEHEVSQCLDFFKLSPDDRWNSLEKGRTVLYLSETSSDF